MKICIPVKVDTLTEEYKVAETFHGAKHFYIYQIESKKQELFTYETILERYGKTDLLEALINDGLIAIISNNITPMAWKAIKEMNIEILKPVSDDVTDNVRCFLIQNMQLFNQKDAKSDSSCGTSCNDCSSNECSTKN